MLFFFIRISLNIHLSWQIQRYINSKERFSQKWGTKTDHSDVGYLMMVTVSKCWWQNYYAGSFYIEKMTSFFVTNIYDLQHLSPTSTVVSCCFWSRMNYHKSGWAWSWTNMSHVTWLMKHIYTKNVDQKIRRSKKFDPCDYKQPKLTVYPCLIPTLGTTEEVIKSELQEISEKKPEDTF